MKVLPWIALGIGAGVLTLALRGPRRKVAKPAGPGPANDEPASDDEPAVDDKPAAADDEPPPDSGVVVNPDKVQDDGPEVIELPEMVIVADDGKIPFGWCRMRTEDVTPEMVVLANQVLRSDAPLGSTVRIALETGGDLLALIEPHANAARGVSLLEPCV